MNALLQIGLSNAAVCGGMAVLLLPLARWLRRPALTHALSVLILLKLLMPALVNVPVNPHSTARLTPSQQGIVVEAAPSHSVSAPLPLPGDSAEALAQSPVQAGALEATARLTSVSQIAPTRPAPQPSHRLLNTIWKTAADHWRSWLLASWIASAIVLGTVTLSRIIRLRLTLRRATVSGRDITAEAELLSKRLGIRRSPRVRFILGSAPPMLLALFCRPELVIPIHLWDRLDPRQRQTLLLHELAHLRRGDHWVRYLELLATCVYWWHFATWFARRALHEAEEYCCDAWVVWAMPGSSRTYMTTLLDAVEFLSQRPQPRLAATRMLVSGMGQFHDLQRRLTMVRERKIQRRLGGRGLAAVVLFSAIALPLGAKLAMGDDQSTAQPGVAPVSRPPGALAATDDPRELTSDAPKALPGADQPDADLSRSAQSQDEVAQLEAELAAARRNVERIGRQLDQVRSKSRWQKDMPRSAAIDALRSVGQGQPAAPATAAPQADGQMVWGRGLRPRASLGHISFVYQDAGSDGMVLAFDRGSKTLMWKLKVPLNADSVIQCYDNETLLIRSADGYTRLVKAEDGKLVKAWAPGVAAPAATASEPVNPFGASAARPNGAPASLPPAPRASSRNGEDQEKRMERMEESIRLLTDAVNRLARQQNDQPSSSAPRLH